MNPTATGHHVQQDGLDTLVLRRTFRTDYPALCAHYAALAAHMTTPTGRGVAGR